jgi:hypothetical protein
MHLTIWDLAAIVAIMIITRPVILFSGIIGRAIMNWTAERLLERKYGQDMARVLMAQSDEEPLEQYIREFVEPQRVSLDKERRPIKRSNV